MRKVQLREVTSLPCVTQRVSIGVGTSKQIELIAHPSVSLSCMPECIMISFNPHNNLQIEVFLLFSFYS